MKKFSLLLIIPFLIQSQAWNQLGGSISSLIGDTQINSFDLNSLGNTIVVGSPSNGSEFVATIGNVNIFQFINNQWVQLGNTIYGDYEFFGQKVAINSEGNTIAIYDPNSNYVKIYEYNNFWDLVTEIEQDDVSDMAFSKDGNSLIIGNEDGNSENYALAGCIRVFLNNENQWNQIGNKICGNMVYDYIGTSIDINNSGTIISFGQDNEQGAGSKVEVYQLINNDWFPKGNPIYPDSISTFQPNYSTKVSLSYTGDTIAVLMNQESQDVFFQDYIQILSFENSEWVPICENFYFDYHVKEFCVNKSFNKMIVSTTMMSENIMDPDDGDDNTFIFTYSKNNQNNWNQLNYVMEFEYDIDKIDLSYSGNIFSLLDDQNNLVNSYELIDENFNQIELFKKQKKLLRVIGILGHNRITIKNQPFIEIYDDGSVEKKYVIE